MTGDDVSTYEGRYKTMHYADALAAVTTQAVTAELLRRDAVLREELLHGTARHVDFPEEWGGSTRYVLPRTRLGRRWLYWRVTRKARKG